MLGMIHVFLLSTFDMAGSRGEWRDDRYWYIIVGVMYVDDLLIYCLSLCCNMVEKISFPLSSVYRMALDLCVEISVLSSLTNADSVF